MTTRVLKFGVVPDFAAIPNFIRSRRWWLLPLAVWIGVVAFALHLNIVEIHRQGILVATEGARNMFRIVVLTRAWNSSHAGVYVPVTKSTQPNAYLNVPWRDVTTTAGVALTLINPAYMTRLIAEMAETESGAVFRLTSLKPIRPQNAPDDWERKSLTAFEAGESESVSIESNPQGDVLRYMAPLKVKPDCLQCHAGQGYKIGDVRGGISVSQRYAPIDAASHAIIGQSMLTYGAVFLLVSALGWTLLELLRRRWFELAGTIGELDAARENLVQSEKMASLGRMVAGFAHEINTPVGVAVGAVSHGEEALARIDGLLAQEDVSEQALRAELGDLRQGSALALANLRRAAQLVQSFKRTSVDQASEEIRLFGVRELIDDVLFALHNTLKRLPIQVKVDCPGELRIEGMPGLIEQLLTNLLMNAVRHGFDDGARPGNIEIRVTATDADVRIEFADDGAGMAKEQVPRVFEPFFTTRRGAGGSGLGLYICYTIVTEQLRGTIACESDSESGCRFEIRFPARIAGPNGKATP